MAALPAEIQDRVNGCSNLRDHVRAEQTHRELTGRRGDRELREVSDDELVAWEAWYVNRINELLEPYEE